ncbi:MAG TPA: patatin-like phospholipase family protein [Gemmatimonadales bacterium]
MTRVPGLALVLSGGGARASYQVGVLSYIAERLPHLEIPIMTGVSAGAINIAYLASHRGTFKERVTSIQGQWLQLFAENVYRLPPGNILAAGLRWAWHTSFRRYGGPSSIHGFVDTEPLARFLSKGIDFDGIKANIKDGSLTAVAFTTTSYASGATVTFVDGAPEVEVWRRAQRVAIKTEVGLRHVMASSALPFIFPAIKLDDGYYGDGSIRQTAPLSPAVHLGAERILAIAMRSQRPEHLTTAETEMYPTAAQLMALFFHTIFLDSLDGDVERLQRMNRLIEALPPRTTVPMAMRPVKLLIVRPSKDLGALAKGYRYHLPWYVNMVVRSVGGFGERSADFLSYLLFDPEYTGYLMELGYDDAKAQWDGIERFLA